MLSTRLAIAMVALVMFTATVAGLWTHHSLEASLVPQAQERVKSHVRVLAEELQAYLQIPQADILGFRVAVALEGIIQAQMAGGASPDGVSEATWRERMAKRFAAELQVKPAYYQFRVIDDSGREIVRVDRSGKDGAIRVVPDNELQSKKESYYFQEAMGVPAGKIYISHLDLNRENGVVETPVVPVIRVASVVRRPDGRPFGIVIINVDMRPILQRLRALAEPGTHVYMVNKKNEYLLHPESDREFAFEFGQSSGLRDDLPGLEAALDANFGGIKSFTDATGEKFDFAPAVVPLMDDDRLIIIETIPHSLVLAPAAEARKSVLQASGAAVLAAIVLAALLSRSLTRPLVQMTSAVQAFTGNGPMAVPVSAGGEIGVLARTFKSMAAEIRNRSAAIERYTRRERLYIAAVESSALGFLTTGTDGTITAWAPGAERLFGFSANEAVGRHISIIVPDDRREESQAIHGTVAENHRIENFITVRRRKDGKRIDIALIISPLRTPGGTVIGQSIIARDMPEQKLAEEKFRLAVESCPSGMVMVDATGNIVLVNGEVERLFGYSREELIGQPVDILVPQKLRTHHVRHRDGFAVRPETRRMGAGRDLFGCRKDGTEFPVEVALNPIQSGDELLVLSVIVDISERKRIDRLKDEFVSTVSHELRTPLTSIAASLGLLTGTAAADLPDNVSRLISIAHANSQRLIRLINDILDIEKMESDKLFFDLQRVEVRLLVEQAIEANRSFAEGSGVQLRLDDASVSAEVRADPHRLTQVITNLLSNAIKFSPANEEVLVAVETSAAGVRISVRDHGAGIPADFRPHVFEKFAQAEATDARRKGGTGLGLSIVKQIVLRLGGKVDFADAPGGGTVFHVELPALEPVGNEGLDPDGKAAGGRILLCEDDADVALTLRQRLGQAGFAADIAPTAGAAVANAMATDYAAVLVDLQLPDGDGISLIQKLRVLPNYGDTPIIVISANPGRGREDMRSPNLNVLDWLAKPLDVDDLLRKLNRSIPSDSAKRPCVLHVDDDANVLGLVAQALGNIVDVVSVATIDDARCALAANSFDLAVIDLALGSGSSLDLLSELHDGAGDAIPVIVYSAQGANPVCAAQVQAALTKSRSSIDSLIATLRKRLAQNRQPASAESEHA